MIRVVLALLMVILIGGEALAVEIIGDKFYLNGQVVNKDTRIEGRLFGARMVMGAIHDYNASTQKHWGDPWNPEANVDSLISNLASYKARGFNFMTVGMQGGHPGFGCSSAPSASGRNFSMFTSDGVLRADAKARLTRLIRAADLLDIIVSVQVFYQNAQRVNANSIKKALTEATTFLSSLGTGNILIEIANEITNNNYSESPALKPDQIDERISQVKGIWPAALVTANFGGAGQIGPVASQRLVDWVSIHANGLSASELRNKINQIKDNNNTRGKPIVVTEDYWDGGGPLNVAVDEKVGWALYEKGCKGYQHLFGGIDWAWDATADSKAFFTELGRLVSGVIVVPEPPPAPAYELFNPTSIHPDRPRPPESPAVGAQEVASSVELKEAIADRAQHIFLNGDFVISDARGIVPAHGQTFWIDAKAGTKIHGSVDFLFNLKPGNDDSRMVEDVSFVGVGGKFHMQGAKINAIQLGKNTNIMHFEIEGCGRNAFGGGSCPGLRAINGDIHNCGTIDELGHGAAGVKVANFDGASFEFVDFHHNIGNGQWADVGAFTQTCLNCRSWANKRKGYHYEISWGPALYRSCEAWDNGFGGDRDGSDRPLSDGGFVIVSSENVTYDDCHAKGNLNDFLIKQDRRDKPIPTVGDVLIKSNCTFESLRKVNLAPGAVVVEGS